VAAVVAPEAEVVREVVVAPEAVVEPEAELATAVAERELDRVPALEALVRVRRARAPQAQVAQIQATPAVLIAGRKKHPEISKNHRFSLKSNS
jgi:hypothetical protein